ncbi:hypothetical protein FG386_001402 [Cryptosporidium ryanae]|uniref:uncharacterized protein n=1 Tax=Cryptosporidium ryanae TaxID=515981 RepID=UPI00351A5E2A|nr:hypothetical protein FG386_001402 [Cryptosporidium ryanae]
MQINKRRSEIKTQSIFDYRSFIDALEEAGVRRSRAYNIWQSLIKKNINDINKIKDVPKKVLKIIEEKFTILNISVVNSWTSENGETTKLIFKLADSHEIESVIMRYGKNESGVNGNSGFRRISLCVSSQIGCRMGCMFCATGSMGLRGSLLSGEIIQQLYYVRNVLGEPVRNVVFMGMGEPLENYTEVVDSIRFMIDQRLFSLSSGHILVSTVGIPTNIVNLADDLPGIGLCLSLHAPNQQLRERIIPIARIYKITDLIRSLDVFIFKTIINRCYNKLIDDRNKHLIKNNMSFDDILVSNRLLHNHKMIVIEYTLLKGINDSVEQANELAELLINTPIPKNIIDDLFQARESNAFNYCFNDNSEVNNDILSNMNIINDKLKRNLIKTIYKELSKNYNRINFTLVNLIPYNKTSTSTQFSTPSKETINEFASVLGEHKIVVTIRRTMGDDIYGACGQLALKQDKEYNIEELNDTSHSIKSYHFSQDCDNSSNYSDIDDSEFDVILYEDKKYNIPTLRSKINDLDIFGFLYSSFSITKNYIKYHFMNNKLSISLLVGTGIFAHYLLYRRIKNKF